MSTEVGKGTCPVCGSGVRVMGSDEGTMYYEPIPPFSGGDLAIIAEALGGIADLLGNVPSLSAKHVSSVAVLKELQSRALQLAFMEVSRDA